MQRLLAVAVSIPTRLERRVQLIRPLCRVTIVCFNPHPPRKAGAIAVSDQTSPRDGCFNPHPPRKAGAIGRPGRCRFRQYRFNPHPPRKAGAIHKRVALVPYSRVSIPTRLERRVQYVFRVDKLRVPCFNPHPPRKAGAITEISGGGRSALSFNPHPPRKAGAIDGVAKFGEQVYSFNPHPPRKAGAMLGIRRITCPHRSFNPHPPRKAGAIRYDGKGGHRERVSIPTRLERRVQCKR